MELWPADLNQLLLSLAGRRLFHDIGSGGYLPCDHQELSCQLALIASYKPQQLLFWHAAPSATMIASYEDPDTALESIREWAGDEAEVFVLPASALRDQPEIRES